MPSSLNLELKRKLTYIQNGYRVTCFVRDEFGIDGRIMFRNDFFPAENQPLRTLLKYHFRSAVLCNMKGRGPLYDWDEDIPPGSDEVTEIIRSEGGKTRFELEMASRLNYQRA